jgi:hypothetical protein
VTGTTIAKPVPASFRHENSRNGALTGLAAWWRGGGQRVRFGAEVVMTKRMPSPTRRRFVQGAAAAAGAVALGAPLAEADAAPNLDSFIAKPPAGFTPLTTPGKLTKVSAKGDFASFMQPNQLWPKAEVAKSLLEKAMMEFTGGNNLNAAMGRFISKDDTVAIKVNGIAGQKGTYTMATNYEVILPVVEAVLALGVPANKIIVYEQFPDFLAGTRVGVRKWTLPAGVATGTHNNADQVRAHLHRSHGRHQHHDDQRSFDLRLHRHDEEHDARQRQQPPRAPREPSQPADRDAVQSPDRHQPGAPAHH